MIFLANRANLDKRTLLSRIHNRLQTQVSKEESAVEQVWYHTSAGNKIGVRATIVPAVFLNASYPIADAELQVSFDFPQTHSYDFYRIQWVEADRNLMVGFRQDETHPDLGKCHVQIDYAGETVQRERADFRDAHPLNVFERRVTDLGSVLDALTWDTGVPHVPEQTIS